MKKFILIMVLAFTLILPKTNVFALTEIEKAMQDFLVSYPTLFYTDAETEALKLAIPDTAQSQRTKDVSFYDFENDGVPEAAVETLYYEWTSVAIYKYVDGEYQLVPVINNTNDKIYETDSIYGADNFYVDQYGQKFVLSSGQGEYTSSTVDYKDGKIYTTKFPVKEFAIFEDYEPVGLVDTSMKEIQKLDVPDIYASAEAVVRADMENKASTGEITLLINGRAVESPTPPQIVDGSCLIPLRVIGDNLGYETSWDEKSKQIDIKNEEHSIQLQIDNNEAIVDGEKMTVDPAPQIINGTTMVPIRFVADGMGCSIGWVDEINTVSLIG